MIRARCSMFVVVLANALLVASSASHAQHTSGASPRQLEPLDRGIVAVHQGTGKVFVSWRLLATDPESIAFNVYRATGGGEPVKLNAAPIDSRK